MVLALRQKPTGKRRYQDSQTHRWRFALLVGNGHPSPGAVMGDSLPRGAEKATDSLQLLQRTRRSSFVQQEDAADSLVLPKDRLAQFVALPRKEPWGPQQPYCSPLYGYLSAAVDAASFANIVGGLGLSFPLLEEQAWFQPIAKGALDSTKLIGWPYLG